ncbi:hypothetical protein ES705_46708 [subsurface metagenome]
MENLRKDESQMTVVNTRKAAYELFSLLKELLSDRKIYCLSTNLTPKDRKNRIKEISNMLNNDSCILVSTQLIEAGVDLSFDKVDRDFAPLDSIIQSAGRCNRHNMRESGKVTIWHFADAKGRSYANMVYRDPILLGVTKEVLEKRKSFNESYFFDLGNHYFKLMYERSEAQQIDKLLLEGEFQQLEKEFLLIDNKWFQQSYFVIQDAKDQRIWDWFKALDDIECPMARRREFLKQRAELYERVIQVPLRSEERPDNSIVALYSEEKRYNTETGYIIEHSGESSIAIF